MNTNNRFNVLLENNNNNNNNNNNKTKVVKNNEPKNTSFNNFRSNNYTNNRNQYEIDYRMFKEEKSKKQKEENIVKALDISNFPDLKSRDSTTTSKSEKEKEKTTFVEVMKNTMQNVATINKVNIEEVEDEIVKPGCVCIKQDNKTNQLVWVYGDGCLEVNKQNDNLVSEEDPIYVFERVTKLYQSRKNKHIQTWGYDEYDKMFHFQNYDYDYFDKLDETYWNELSNNYYKPKNNDYSDYGYYIDNLV